MNLLLSKDLAINYITL
jgi:hypothetical protein